MLSNSSDGIASASMTLTLIHVLGRADFLAEGDSVAGAVAQLKAVGGQAPRAALTSTGSPHHGGAPLENLMLEVERAIHPSPLPPVRVLLVATSQEAPHAGDTLPLAELIEEEVRRDPSLYGPRVQVEIVTIPSVGADATRRLVAPALLGHHPVFVGLAGGPTSTTIGVLLACADAGVVPHLLESRDADSQHAPLQASPSIERYLARSRQYGALRSPSTSHLHAALHQYQTLNLAALTEALANSSVTDTLRRVLQIPAGSQGVGNARRAAGAAVLAAICRNSWTDALFIERWLRYRHAELEAQLDLAERTRCKQLFDNFRRAAVVQGPLVKRLGNSGVWRKALRNVQADAGDEVMRNQILAAASQLVDESIRSARRAANQADGFETLHEMTDKRHLLDQLPQALAQLHGSKEFSTLWRLRNEAHHGGHDRGAQLARYAGFLCLDDDPVLDACAAVGADLPRSPVGPRSQLVLLAVGNRNEQHGTYPMLEAVEVANLGGAKPHHLRTLSSEELLDAAERQLVHASDGWASTDLIRTSIEFAGKIQAAVVDSVLRDRSLTTVDGLTVAIGPGTKAMNVGLLMAAFELSVILGADVSVLELARMAGSDATEVRSLGADKEIATQFIDPVSLAAPLRHCLERAEFGAALDLLEIGPPKWRAALRPLLDDLLGGFTNPSPNRQAVRDALLICRRRASTDPVGAVAHADHLLATVNLSSAKLTRWRNDILHGRADRIPGAKDVEVELAAAVRELGSTTSRLVAQHANALRLLDQFVTAMDDSARRVLDLTVGEPVVEMDIGVEAEFPPVDPSRTIPVLRSDDVADDSEADDGEESLVDDAAESGPVAATDPEHMPDPSARSADEALPAAADVVELVNLTPHEVCIFCDNGAVLRLPPAERPARVQMNRLNAVTLNSIGGEVRVASVIVGDVVDLPFPRPSTLYVVSRLVAERSPGPHLLVPDELVRDEQSGAVIGCRSFTRSEAGA